MKGYQLLTTRNCYLQFDDDLNEKSLFKSKT